MISVCVVLYRSAGVLPGLLTSLVRQTRRPDRVVLCLNGPDDGVRATLAATDLEVDLIERPENPGFAGGMNALIERCADSEFLFLLNPDVELEADHLEKLHQALVEEPDAAGVQGLLFRPATETSALRIDSAGFMTQPWLRIVDRGAGSADLEAFSERESVQGICAAAALFRRAALLEVAEQGQVFDEDFWMYKEDQDLCLRLRSAGLRLLFEPAARGYHARGFAYGARAQVDLELRRHSLKNRYLLLLKHWRWRQQAWTLPFVLVFELLLFLGLLLREPRTLKAYLMALRLLPSALDKRRRLLDRERHDAKLGPARPGLHWVVTR